MRIMRCGSARRSAASAAAVTTIADTSAPGNYFAQYTRKFSLGNGPVDWVAEYLITKEGGKMLGTLVALALGRMRNLEAFTWDMPTGVLRDVWLALASLGNRDDGHDCRLEKVWVRWHDNRDAAPPAGSANLPSLLHGTASSLFHIPPYPSVEFPTFSILPPLKSISVLDIDEVPYAEELSILLDRSLDRVQELRVGVALHAQRDLPFRPIEDRSVVPPPFPAGDEHARPGGILGILVSRFCSAFGPTPVHPLTMAPSVPNHALHMSHVGDTRATILAKESGAPVEVSDADVEQLGAMLSSHSLSDAVQDGHVPPSGYPLLLGASAPPPVFGIERRGTVGEQVPREQQTRKLKLATLELERIYLSIPVLSRAIDWSRLESLTLLGCMNHEQLWKALRKTFTPASVRNRSSPSKPGSHTSSLRSSAMSLNAIEPTEYRLNIRKLHTDTVSKALLAFIKDTLAPDTLEWLFLQETNAYKPTVTMDEIYRSAVRRHRGSLRKLLIDSEIRDKPLLRDRDRDREREVTDTSWRRWICHQDLITCITSGKMQLRELSISVDYKNWHYFLQRLPNNPGLRSLHIAHVADHPYGRLFDPRDVALQLLDIISLRPDMELCYLAIEKKCFEILEYKSSYLRRTGPPIATRPLDQHGNTIGGTPHPMMDEEDDDEHEDGGAAHPINHFAAPELSDEEEDNWEMGSHGSSNLDETEDENDEEDDGGSAGAGRGKLVFRLREILFYDDKISIFKARHGKL